MAVAMTECQLLVITRADVTNLLKSWPAVKREMKLVAQRREARYNKAINQLLKRMQEQDEMVMGNANLPMRLNAGLIYSSHRSVDAAKRDPMARSLAMGR